MTEHLMQDSVMRDMSEGVILVGFDGMIRYLNPSAERILGVGVSDTRGRRFVECFMGSEEKDEFVQTVLDAVYDKTAVHSKVVPYPVGDSLRQLYVVTSFLRDGAEPVGVIVVLNDITELSELKIEYARQVTVLLDSLVGALSAAIEDRSRYNANHTRNMVRYAERFLDYLNETDNEWRFDEDKRRAFIMSVWLHDVGKLAVPLTIMDKATRLGRCLSDVRNRFTEMSLLNRIACLEGRVSEEKYRSREEEQKETLAFVERLNTQGFLADEDLERLDALADRTYVNASGEIRPWLTEEELTDLRVRRGTLTDQERQIMESHATTTEHILKRVQFPPLYAQVPFWAAAHHELLNGRGYPHHLAGREIPREVRLLTILDIFDALTASDRPYKPPMPVEKALGIMENMVREGAVDGELLSLFQASRAWED